MPTSDVDIQRTAHHFIQLYGDRATAKAREMVEELRRKGDNEGPIDGYRLSSQLANLVIRRQM